AVPVARSRDVLPQSREYERCPTTVTDASLAPLLDRYLGSLTAACEERGIPAPLVMQSSGGVAPAAEAARAGAWSVLSGPAGGAGGGGPPPRGRGGGGPGGVGRGGAPWGGAGGGGGGGGGARGRGGGGAARPPPRAGG